MTGPIERACTGGFSIAGAVAITAQATVAGAFLKAFDFLTEKAGA
jgi:hypothetical protein